MYKILNYHTAPNLKQVFLSNKERANPYNLRNKETDLALPNSKKQFGKSCFNYKGASHWNIADSLRSFNAILKQK
jgi:hypothetical protein